MEKAASQNTKQIALILTVALTAIVGLGLIPFTENFVFDTKFFSFVFTTLALFVLFVFQAWQRGSFNIALPSYTAPLLLFGASAIASTFLTNEYPVEHLLGFGGTFIAMVIFALIGGSILPKKSTLPLLATMSIVGVLLTLFSVLELAGFGPSKLYIQLFGLNLPSTLLFNMSGSSLIATQIILSAIVGMIGYSVLTKHVPKFFALTFPILIIGAAVHAWSLLPGKPAELRLPSLGASWSVALDAIRQPRSALIGVGSSSYQNVYSQFKPLWVNGTPDWNVAFAQATNTPFTILTTMGFLGLIGWTLLAIQVCRQLKTKNEETKTLAIIGVFSILMQLVLPINVVGAALFGILLAALTASQRDQLSVLKFHALSAYISGPRTLDDVLTGNKQKTVNPFLLVALILFAGVGALGYFVGRAYASQALLFSSSRAAQKNDAVKTYELQQRAVELNPYLDSIRRRYALTNILIAVALSNKTDITEDERTQVTQLLQQAIREARSATLLDPNDTQNWIVLAQIYENIIGATEEAASWSVQSYVRAIETNPTDPSLRIALGGIFLSQKQFEQAANLFKQATEIKPDFANAHYNLALALRELNQLEASKTEYQRVLVLLDPNSQDYTNVTTELEGLEKAIKAQGEQVEATEDDQAQVKPSIIDQNIESESSVISNPSTDVTPESGVNQALEPATAASPSPSPEPVE